MLGRLENKLDCKVFLWGVLLLPFLVIPLGFLLQKSQHESIHWNIAAYYFIAPFFVAVVTLVIAWFYRKEVPKIIITPEDIYFGKQQIPFGQIRKIDVLATGQNISEKSIIYLKNNEGVHFAISLY